MELAGADRGEKVSLTGTDACSGGGGESLCRSVDELGALTVARDYDFGVGALGDGLACVSSCA